MTCLNVLEGEIWKREKSWKSERSNQNIVMNENIVMDAKILPKVGMGVSMFKIGGCNNLQPSNQNLLKEIIDENEPWVVDRNSNRDPSFVTQKLGETLWPMATMLEI